MVNPIWLILYPLCGAFVISMLYSFKSGFVAKTIAISAVLFNAVLALYFLVNTNTPVSITIAGFAPPVGINLVVDHFSAFVLAVANFIAVLSVVYSLNHIKENANKYYILFLLLIAGSNGMLLTGDIFNMFVFFEIICISSYALVAFEQNKNGFEASLKYLILGTLGSILILTAIALIYMTTGTLNFGDIAVKFSSVENGYKVLIAIFLLSGLGIEAAIFPFNTWLPDAHSSAPSPISAVLSGFVIEIPLLIIVKIITTILGFSSFSSIFVVLGLTTLLVGEISAFKQTNIKRALAYSSMGQIGLMLIVLGTTSTEALTGALMVFLNHAFAKSLLFFSAGSMIKSTGSYEISDYKGLAKKMPLSAFAFVIGALSLIGVPPLFGFFSKFMAIKSIVSSGGYLVATLILLGTIIETVYFVQIIQKLYNKKEAEGAIKQSSSLLASLVSIILIAGITGSMFVISGIINFGNLSAVSFLTKPFN